MSAQTVAKTIFPIAGAVAVGAWAFLWLAPKKK